MKFKNKNYFRKNENFNQKLEQNELLHIKGLSVEYYTFYTDFSRHFRF